VSFLGERLVLIVQEENAIALAVAPKPSKALRRVQLLLFIFLQTSSG
jgi:hypothetical protein